VQDKLVESEDMVQLRRNVVSHAQKQVNDFRSSLNELRRNQGGLYERASMWSPDAARLLNAVHQNRGSFSQVPIGPIGAHVSISDERCARRHLKLYI
jgi:hypothetical protein